MASFILQHLFHSAATPWRKKKHKNAFEWDADRPLVDRIPACTVEGGVYPRGGSAQGKGGVCLGEGVSQHAMGQIPPVDRQTPVKT